MEKGKGGGKRPGAEHRSPKKDREPNTKAKKRPGAEHKSKKKTGSRTQERFGGEHKKDLGAKKKDLEAKQKVLLLNSKNRMIEVCMITEFLYSVSLNDITELPRQKQCWATLLLYHFEPRRETSG